MKIKQLLDGVENLDLVMPEFQREYVWSLELAKQLFVSLYKDYPTGSLLFWEAKGEDVPEIKNNAVNPDKLGLTKVILDGQQRLTTLYLIIKGEIPPYYKETDLLQDPRHLYFNLSTGEFNYLMKKRMEGNPLWQNVTDCFDLKKVDALDIAEEYSDKVPDVEFKVLSRLVNNNLTRLRSIEEIDYPIQSVPSSAKIDEAIDVFDRVNSKGTKLTDAELVLTHITGKWSKARRTIKKKITELEKENFYFDLDFFTRCMVVALTESALYDRNSKLNYEEFSQENYINAWERVSKSIDFIIPILKQDANIGSSSDMTSHNVLVPLIAYLLKNNIRISENLKYGYIYWMLLALIWSRYSGQTDTRLDKDVYISINEADPIDSLVAEIEDQRGRIEVKPSDLEGRGAGHPLYKMLYIVTKYKKAIDWANGGSIRDTIGESYTINSHHIFPQYQLYKLLYDSENHLDKKKVNEIANRAFITRDTNYELYTDIPKNYLPLIEKKYPGALERQFVPMNQELWDIKNYEMFLQKRREIIADEINNFFTHLNDQYKLQKKTKPTTQVEELITGGENNYVEFKSSLRWDLKAENVNKELEYVIAKTIVAFLNTEGGTLIIGVNDEKEIIGIENDYKTFGKKQNQDGFMLKLSDIINNYIGKEFHQYINSRITKVESKDICIVSISKSNLPSYCKINNSDKFFVRAQASTEPLGYQEAVEYIKAHWNNNK